MNLSEQCRIFKEFYKLSNHDKQNKYLIGLIRHALPRDRAQSASAKSRSNSFSYYLRLRSGTTVQVCKKVFQHAYGISKRRGEQLCKKLFLEFSFLVMVGESSTISLTEWI